MKSSSAFSVLRLVKATGYSLAGLAAAWRGEASFRLELALAVVFVPLGFWLGASGVERALLAGSVVLVLVVELINSSIEAVADCASPGEHPLVKRAKDLGSAAVMASLLAAVVIWGAVLA
jgi:diacylglycerol kinase (ATP)